MMKHNPEGLYNERLIDAVDVVMEELEKIKDDPIAEEAWRTLDELKGKDGRVWGTPHKLGRIPNRFID